MKQEAHMETGLTVLPADRDRLVRLCAHLSRCAAAAEDLAQETLIEAWRHRHKLERPDGQSQWLAAIARNVCMRWRTRQAREHSFQIRSTGEYNLDGDWDEGAYLWDDVDLELRLERQELADLLDRALALLPAATRQALLYHYVEDLSHGDIAALLGMSEGAVAVRVHRGKVALRRVLYGDEFNLHEFGLPHRDSEPWETTRLWCSTCGTRRLLGRMTGSPMELVLRCPGGCGGASGVQTQSIIPGRIVSGAYGRALSRIRRAVDRHYGLNRLEDVPRCSECGRRTPLRVGSPDGLPVGMQTPDIHVYLRCDACHTVSHSSLHGAALSIPAGQTFIRRHPRLHPPHVQEVEIDGLPAFVTRFASRDNAATLDVLIRQRDFRTISVHGIPAS
jgi:RNA polymerase sigma factor (sigma-70 family)